MLRWKILNPSCRRQGRVIVRTCHRQGRRWTLQPQIIMSVSSEETILWEQRKEAVQEANLLNLKFLHKTPESHSDNPEPVIKASSPRPVVTPSSDALCGMSRVLSLPCLTSAMTPPPRVPPHGPPTLEHLRVELHDMREELQQLKTQHKTEIKLLMNELDEEKKKRLSMQVEVDRLKKHMSKHAVHQ